MSVISQSLDNINFLDKYFVGTITFRSEEQTLPNGSKMALGLDDGHWVLIHQKAPDMEMKVYKYDHNEKQIVIDQKNGGEKEIAEFMEQLKYFFTHARTEDLVTLLPPQA
jgi:hypothetical protein